MRPRELAVLEQLDLVAVGVGDDGDRRAGLDHVSQGPVGEEVDHGVGGVLGLVEVVEVLGEAGGVEDAHGGVAEGPVAAVGLGLAEVVEGGPLELAGDPGGFAQCDLVHWRQDMRTRALS